MKPSRPESESRGDAGGGRMTALLSSLLGLLTSIGGYAEATSISTGSEAGSQFGLRLLWPLILGTIGLILLIEMVGRWAAVTRTSYAGSIRQHFGLPFYLIPVGAELIADTLLLAAELGGMATGFTLLSGIPLRLTFLGCAILVWAALWYLRFQDIERWPALAGLISLAFVVGIVAAHGPSPAELATLWHPLTVGGGQVGEYLFLVGAVLGATISPYLVVFYASGAREERWTPRSLALNRFTAIAGIGIGSVIGIAIVVLSAIVLGPKHTDASTLEIASQLLSSPFGNVGRILFAVILIVTCFSAALEVALAVSFNVSQGFGWSWEVNAPFRTTVRFRLTVLAILVASTVLGLIVTNPLALALVASSVMALVLPAALGPFLVLMNDRRNLGNYANGRIRNLAVLVIVILACLVSLTTIPLLIIGGGG